MTWWQDATTEIAQIEVTDAFLRTLHAREHGKRWEYAIVRWVEGRATLEWVFCEGIVIAKQGWV